MSLSFKPYRYEHIDGLLRYYAQILNKPEIPRILDSGICNEIDAKTFCDFIPLLLDQRIVDEESGKEFPVEIGSAIILDLNYEAGAFVCDAGFEHIWQDMIDNL